MNKPKMVVTIVLQSFFVYLLLRIFISGATKDPFLKVIGASAILGGIAIYCLFYPDTMTKMLNQSPIDPLPMSKQKIRIVGWLFGVCAVVLLIAAFWVYGVQNTLSRVLTVLF